MEKGVKTAASQITATKRQPLATVDPPPRPPPPLETDVTQTQETPARITPLPPTRLFASAPCFLISSLTCAPRLRPAPAALRLAAPSYTQHSLASGSCFLRAPSSAGMPAASRCAGARSGQRLCAFVAGLLPRVLDHLNQMISFIGMPSNVNLQGQRSIPRVLLLLEHGCWAKMMYECIYAR